MRVPVHTRAGVVYRPYTYCGEHLVRSAYIPWFDPRHDDLRLGYRAPVFDGPAYRAGYLHRGYFERHHADHARRAVRYHDRYDDRYDRRHDDRHERHDGRHGDRDDRRRGRGRGHDRHDD